MKKLLLLLVLLVSCGSVAATQADAEIKARQYCTDHGGTMDGPTPMGTDITGRNYVLIVCIDGDLDTEYYA